MVRRLSVPRLMLVTDASRAHLPLLDLAEAAVAGGADAIYLRGGRKTEAGGEGTGNGDEAQTVELAKPLRARIGERAAVLMNGSAQAAFTAGASLHLRERDPAPADARRVLGPAALIGRSVHSPEAAAESAGVDYLLAGHVYPSASKPGIRPLGLERFAAIVAAAPCPVLAIGGITPGRVAEVINAGAHGVAVIGAIAEAGDPRAAAASLRAALDRALSLRDSQEESGIMDTTERSQAGTTVEIVVNGKPVKVASGHTVHDFLASKRMTDQMAIVERNGEIVPRGEYGETALAAGDRLEVVHAVGGG